MGIDRRLFFKSVASAPAMKWTDANGEKRERVRSCLVVFDSSLFEIEWIQNLANFMGEKGWDGFFIGAYRPTADLQLFDIDTLKPADATEIRELLKGIQDGN